MTTNLFVQSSKFSHICSREFKGKVSAQEKTIEYPKAKIFCQIASIILFNQPLPHVKVYF